MKSRYLLIALLAIGLVFSLAGQQGAKAEIINFDSQGLTGPSLFVSAVPSPQHLDILTSIGIVQFDGGVILTQTANLPADQTSVYGTAGFGIGLSNPLTITFPSNITNFFLDVLNGLTTDCDYRVADNLGHFATFTLVPNLSSGQTLIGFPATGNIITIASITQPTTNWDFFIDNVQFNAPLPPGLNVPEPATLLLLGFGLAGLAGFRRRMQKR